MALKMDGAKPAADTLGHGESRDLVGGRPGWMEAGLRSPVDRFRIENPGGSSSKEG